MLPTSPECGGESGSCDTGTRHFGSDFSGDCPTESSCKPNFLCSRDRISPKGAPKIVSDVTSRILPIVAPKILPNVTPKILPNVTPRLLTEITQKTLPNVTTQNLSIYVPTSASINVPCARRSTRIVKPVVRYGLS